MGPGAEGVPTEAGSSSSSRASPISRSRRAGSFCRHLRSSATTWLGVDRGQRGPVGLLPHDRSEHVGDRVAGEGATAADHLEQHTPEGPDVGAAIHRASPRLFGRHVGGGADNRSHRCRAGGQGGGFHRVRARRARRVHHLRESKVQDLHGAVRTDLDVRRLEVAMDDPGVVRGLQRPGNLSRDRQRVVDLNTCGHRCRLAPLGDQFGEILPRHQLHDDGAPLDGVYRRDVRMVERGQRRRLALESRESIRISGHGLGQHLDRDVTTELRVARAIHLAHAPFANLAEDAIRSEIVTAIHRVLGLASTTPPPIPPHLHEHKPPAPSMDTTSEPRRLPGARVKRERRSIAQLGHVAREGGHPASAAPDLDVACGIGIEAGTSCRCSGRTHATCRTRSACLEEYRTRCSDRSRRQRLSETAHQARHAPVRSCAGDTESSRGSRLVDLAADPQRRRRRRRLWVRFRGDFNVQLRRAVEYHRKCTTDLTMGARRFGEKDDGAAGQLSEVVAPVGLRGRVVIIEPCRFTANDSNDEMPRTGSSRSG